MSTSARTLELGRVGESVRRVDAITKVTGEFAYSSDLFAAGMLWGHTLRSPHAHALITDVDISEALGMPGVHAVLTHDDVPGAKTYGLEFADQPVLAIDRVRYFGEAVAVVAAEHPEQARRAAERIRVEYEPLEPVVDPELATEQEPLHEGRPTQGHGFRDDPRPNVVRTLVIRHGDPAAQGEVSVSGRYELGIQDQAFLGPESGLAIPDGEGGIDVFVATQWLHVDRDQVAPCLGLEPEQVRIHLAGVGGAFGGREDLSMQIHASMLALHANRPVKMVYNREESFVGHIHRHPAKLWLEHRANRDGKLVNVRARILLDGGAYASSSTAVTANASSFACGPYAVENALIECTCVYTNNPPCGAMRGFGAVQSCFAHEAQMDKLAAELGLDPVDLRLRNALAPGDVLPTGQKIAGSLPVAEVIRRCAALPVPEPEELPRDVLRLPGGTGNTTRGEGVKRGVGFAVGFKNVCYSEGFDDSTAARVKVIADADGDLSAEVHCAAAEVGQGVVNVILQTARTELELDDVTLGPATTGTVGSAGSASASRMTWMSAGAVQLACRAAKEELTRRGGLEPGASIDLERVYHHRRTVPLDPETGQITGESGAHVAYVCAAMRVVVEVDVDLGLTRVVWIGTAQDVGKAVNPQAVYGQIEGGTAQGLGLALMEEIQTSRGLITNASFTDYLIPTTLDMPPVDAELVEVPEPEAPFGVKGVGEPPTVVSTAAIVSALREASGRELTRVPVRPDELVGL
ncbi:MAG TPA: molybdopterin cofactor-binding domain-containing protein [Gaiellaceae bacterium]|nr:molybdopterin cofactor-binding domain-containing protein [Gaiellaceae bacterium]